jgi:hypothetical protein
VCDKIHSLTFKNMIMSELMNETKEVESKCDEQDFAELMETYEQIPNKRCLNKEEQDLKKEIVSFLYYEKKMRDVEIGKILRVPQTQIGSWRRRENLPANRKDKMVIEEKLPAQKRGDYYRSPEEIEKVVRFIVRARSVIDGEAQDSNGKSTSLRKILDKEV